MCNLGYLGTIFVDQCGLELTKIHMPLLPEFWDEKVTPPPAGQMLKNIFNCTHFAHMPHTYLPFHSHPIGFGWT